MDENGGRLFRRLYSDPTLLSTEEIKGKRLVVFKREIEPVFLQKIEAALKDPWVMKLREASKAASEQIASQEHADEDSDTLITISPQGGFGVSSVGYIPEINLWTESAISYITNDHGEFLSRLFLPNSTDRYIDPKNFTEISIEFRVGKFIGESPKGHYPIQRLNHLSTNIKFEVGVGAVVGKYTTASRAMEMRFLGNKPYTQADLEKEVRELVENVKNRHYYHTKEDFED